MFKKKFLKIKNKNDTKHNLIFKDYQPNNIISVEPKFIHHTDFFFLKKKINHLSINHTWRNTHGFF